MHVNIVDDHEFASVMARLVNQNGTTGIGHYWPIEVEIDGEAYRIDLSIWERPTLQPRKDQSDD